MVYFGKASGANLGLQRTGRKLLLVLIPVLVSLISWYFMVILARGGSITSGGGPLKVFFDIAYPAGDVILLTMGLLIFGLSFRYWSAQLKWPIIVILVGILAEYISDFWFSYATTLNTFYNGCLGDLSFATALMILSVAVTLLDTQGESFSPASTIPAVQPVSNTLVPPSIPSMTPSSIPDAPIAQPASDSSIPQNNQDVTN